MLRNAARGGVLYSRPVLVSLFAGAILVGALLGVFLAYGSELPQVSSLEDFEPNLVTQVLARDGSLIGEFSIERRVPVRFAEIPPVLRNAVIAVEDAEFWTHIGINPWRVPGAILANLRSGRRGQGFSTLTMQLSRLLFLTPEKTYERKLKEILLAFQIERSFTKEEIFTLYCNQIYFGHGNYGVEAASQFYFSKPVGELALTEAAMIAGIAQSPSRLSPIDNAKAVLARRNLVLSRMQEERYISAREAETARASDLGLNLHRPPPSIAPYFLEEVRKYLEREYGSQRIYQGGLQVHTTLDPAMQRAAARAVDDGLHALDRRARGFVRTTESALVDGVLPADLSLRDWGRKLAAGDVVKGVVVAVDRQAATVRVGPHEARLRLADVAWTGRAALGEVFKLGDVAPFRVLEWPADDGPGALKLALEQEPEVEGALLALDVKTGAVRAMVGGYDYGRSKFNRATQARRQAGSTFKPLVYAAAIEAKGFTPATTLLDAPLLYPARAGSPAWAPKNYDGTFWGPIPLRRALENSRNIPAIRTLEAIGVETGIAYARKLGLQGELPPYLPIAIGAGEASLSEMVAAFASFANQGLRMEPWFVTRITDRDGNVIEENHPRGTEALRADTAYIMASLLRGVVERGTATRARALERPIGGKTGTTDDFTDGWFVGFEPGLAAGVWVGFDDKRRSLGRGQDGARSALPIWIDFWKQATADRPIEDYPVPANILLVPVDAAGHLARPGTPGARLEPFVAGTEPGARRAVDAAE